MKKNLFHKDFTLMIIGQIISIFGNSILRFAMSLYILDLTGSATIFASILAISMLPTILLSPIGGMISDRVNRRNIMVVLDFITSILITLFIFTLNSDKIISIIPIFMVLLSLIQCFYQPSVQASIPSITTQENFVSANSIVMQINALSNLVGPIVGAGLYGFLGIFPITCISAICFFFSAVLEIFIHIPFVKQARASSMMCMVKNDFKVAIDFIVRKNPSLFKLLLTLAGLNLFISSLLQIGMPYIIKIQLGLSSQLYGFAESSLAIGMIIGSIVAGKASTHFSIKNSYKLLFITCLSLLPIAVVLFMMVDAMLAYMVIVASVIACCAFSAVFNVIAQSFLQAQTPPQLMGKIASFVTTSVMCSYPIGQALYGILFDVFSSQSYLIIILAVFFGAIISLYTRKSLLKVVEHAA